jgi:hypothetical protein
MARADKGPRIIRLSVQAVRRARLGIFTEFTAPAREKSRREVIQMCFCIRALNIKMHKTLEHS